MACLKNISIIILNYNGYEDTIECLLSIFNLDYSLFNIILIDNASSDRSAERISDWSSGRFAVTTYSDSILKSNPLCFSAGFRIRGIGNVSDLSIIKNSENVGFAAGCNQGINLALSIGAEYIWLLNNDTAVDPDSLSILATYLDQYASCQLATPQIRLYDEPARIWNCGGLLKWYGVRKYLYVHKPVSALPDKDVLDITFVTGCAPLVRSSVFQNLGGFTEKFFFGEEDFDFSLRLKKAHARMVCCLRSIIYHKVGASIDRSSSSYNFAKAYIHYLNRFIDLRNHWPRCFWQAWRMVYILYIYRLLGRQAQCSHQIRVVFIKRLIQESSSLDEVSKDTFLKILHANTEYFMES